MHGFSYKLILNLLQMLGVLQMDFHYFFLQLFVFLK